MKVAFHALGDEKGSIIGLGVADIPRLVRFDEFDDWLEYSFMDLLSIHRGL